MSNSVFSDFCQAWVARFPGSELPAAWEEDVRANLKKHKTKVAILREELEKEEMYVEYLDKLLVDIEEHRKQQLPITDSSLTSEVSSRKPSNPKKTVVVETSILNQENKRRSQELFVATSANKQKFLDDHFEDFTKNGQGAAERTGLHLDLGLAQKGATENDDNTFVTVISVSSPGGSNGEAQSQTPTIAEGSSNSNSDGPSLTYTKNKDKKVPPKPPPKRRSDSRDSLNSVSSPTTPTSPLLSSTEDFLPTNPREGLGINSLGSKDPLLQTKLTSSSDEALNEDLEEDDDDERGRPDGRDNEDSSVKKGANSQSSSGAPKVNKIKELMANWENKPPIGAKPVKMKERESSPGRMMSSGGTKRTDSDSSSRGRMGSPSGKSHDSSDSETSWSRRGSESSPGTRRRISGETRLDRLVRRPSGDKSSSNPGGRYSEGLPVPQLPKPMKKPRAKPRSFNSISSSSSAMPESSEDLAVHEEPLYDTVANDEPEDEYDNHLLYGTSSSAASSSANASAKNKTDTISSSGGGSSSADLGFDEPVSHQTSSSFLKSATSGLSLTGSGTLSSSDTDCLSSPSLNRGMSLEEETNYVNIQYFLHQHLGKTVSSGAMDVMTAQSQSDEELLDRVDHPATHESRPSRAPDSSEAERILMYKCILNSIVDSEAIYLEGLSVMLQYMKAMKVTLTTSQPVIPKEDFDIIFYKIPDLHELHFTFHDSLKKQVDRWNGSESVGHTFKMLASRTKIYAAFLNNYQNALEVLHKCTEAWPQFADLTRSIKLRTVKGQRQGQSLSLEDLLHKPVARVQKHCLCLQDLIKYTPESHPDFVTLNEALSHVQDFVNEYNNMHAGELFPHQERQQRHLVKNSFIVELSEGQRKLRHLFLFNDVLVCAKYKASSKRTEKFTFQLKWFIPLWSVSTSHTIIYNIVVYSIDCFEPCFPYTLVSNSLLVVVQTGSCP